jgi:hypothetical protein
VVTSLIQNTVVNVSEFLCGTMSKTRLLLLMCLSYCVVPCLDQNTVVNVTELLCGTMSRPEYCF